MNTSDVVVIGAGPAGLSAALVLARSNRQVVVIDAGQPRNLVSPGVQGFLSRDGTLPSSLRAVSREQIENYGTVRFINDRVDSIDHTGADQAGITEFNVTTAGGTRIRSRQVLLGVGMQDELPAIEGFKQFWGNRIIHCAFCHGWENNHRQWGVLARNLEEIESAPEFHLWTEDVMVFVTRGLRVPVSLESALRKKGIPIEHRQIVHIHAGRDNRNLEAVELEDGEIVNLGTLVYRPEQSHATLIGSLELELDTEDRIVVSPALETSISGLFAAGDITPGCQDALSAAAEGARAARHMVKQLAACYP